MAATGFARATIHDAAGRLVRRLRSGVLSAGRHEFLWDRRDAAGREVAPGVYLARVSTGTEEKTTRVVILK